MKKLCILAVTAVLLVACETNHPSKAFIGTWEPVGYEEYDIFIITSDSIKAIQCDTKKEHYQSHYKILRDSVAELERCWLKETTQGINSSQSDLNSEQFYIAEVQMYLDKEGYLVIHPFDIVGELSQIVPNYTFLKLRKK